jgi:hypothetical protein
MVKINMNGNYLAECVRLLYWIYFKPFTLAEWVSEIHPDLKSDTNPFSMRAEFRGNPKLRRYAGQVWFLTVAVPPVAALLVGIIYSLAVEPFNWSRSSLLLMGWFLGNCIARGNNSSLRKRFTQILEIVASIIFLMIIGLRFAPELTRSILQIIPLQSLFQSQFFLVALGVALGVGFGVALGVGFGVGFGVALGVGFGVALGVGFGVGFGVALGVGFGVAFGVALGVGFGVGFGVALGVALGVGFGMALGVASGVAFGVAFILGTWRVDLSITKLRLSITKLLLLMFFKQQKVALKAKVEIAIDTLNRCQNSDDIVAIAEKLAWIPSPLPAELGSVLPELLAISQDVRAAENASSAYLRYEMLATPLTKLKGLRKSLVLSKDAVLATSFGSIVQGWLSILETSRQTLEEAALDSAEIPQVYVAGPALNPESSSSRFKGRLDVFREIESLARSSQPPVLLLYGGRRTGKTSALKFLPQKVGSELVPLSIDLQGAAMTTTLSGLAEFIADEIVEAARRNRNLQLPALDRESLNIDPFMALQKWFLHIEKIAPGKRFLLCMDEFERLEEVVRNSGSRSPLNFLRYILQNRDNWILLFSGSHTLDELNPYWNDYLINTQSLRMTYLQESEARDLIRNPIDDFPDIYTEGAIDEIIYLTRCQPYYVQLMCRVLVDSLNAINRENARLNQEKQKQLAAENVQAAILTSLERGGAAFRERYQELTESEREFLHKLINEGVLAVKESRSWQRLVEKEVLEVTEEGYRFQVPLFQKFVEIQSR